MDMDNQVTACAAAFDAYQAWCAAPKTMPEIEKQMLWIAYLRAEIAWNDIVGEVYEAMKYRTDLDRAIETLNDLGDDLAE